MGEEVRRLEPELRDLTARLLAVPSIGGTAEELAAPGVLAEWLAERGVPVALHRSDPEVLKAEAGFPGMEVERTAITTALARLPGDGTAPPLLLHGHLDVVPPAGMLRPFTPEWTSDGELRGRGTVDMKAGMAAAAIAVLAAHRTALPLAGDLLLAGVIGEEDGGSGTFALLTDVLPGQLAGGSAIICEPTGLRPMTANAGALTFRITLAGAAAHGALRWRGVSAADYVAPVLAALRELESRRCAAAGPLFEHWPLAYPISVGTLAGGDWASTVIDEVVLTGRYGVALDEPITAARAEFEAAIAAAAQDAWYRDHPPRVEWWGAQFAPAATDPTAPVVAALRASGAVGPPMGAPYGSDLRLLRAAGMDVVQFGPGEPEMAHSDDERVPWEDVVRAAETLAAVVAGWGR